MSSHFYQNCCKVTKVRVKSSNKELLQPLREDRSRSFHWWEEMRQRGLGETEQVEEIRTISREVKV